MSIVCGIWGNDKTGKSSLALTFPKPMLYMEFDLGGYDRAKYGYNGMGITPRDLEASGDIVIMQYVAPWQGIIDGATVRPSKIIIGIKELWYKFLGDYINKFLSDPKFVTGVFDTGTLLWEMDHTAYLQEKQEVQLDPQGNLKPNERLRVSLKGVEYREPNIRMRGLVYHARVQGKNLVLTHHSRDEYKPMFNSTTGVLEDTKTGKRERAGFGSLGDGTDWMVHTTRDNDGFHGLMDEGSVPDCVVGTVINNPTYDGIMSAVDMALGKRNNDA